MGPLTKNIRLSYEDYLELREKTDNILEYIDGIVYMSPSLSTIHQRISSKLHAKLYNLIEILSPSNQSHDLVTKLNLYMKYGVKEYWIVNPILNTVMLYTLNEDKMYEQSIVKIETGIVKSKLFESFEVNIEELFK